MIPPPDVRPLFPSGPSASPAVNDMLGSRLPAFNQDPLDIRATDYKSQLQARVSSLLDARGPDPTMPLPRVFESNPVTDHMKFQEERFQMPEIHIADPIAAKREMDFELDRCSSYAQQKRDHYSIYDKTPALEPIETISPVEKIMKTFNSDMDDTPSLRSLGIRDPIVSEPIVTPTIPEPIVTRDFSDDYPVHIPIKTVEVPKPTTYYEPPEEPAWKKNLLTVDDTRDLFPIKTPEPVNHLSTILDDPSWERGLTTVDNSLSSIDNSSLSTRKSFTSTYLTPEEPETTLNFDFLKPKEKSLFERTMEMRNDVLSSQDSSFKGLSGFDSDGTWKGF